MKDLHDCGPGASPYSYRGFTIPIHMLQALNRYLYQGIMPGDFLRAVICNDLFLSVGRADDHNVVNLPAYVAYLYNNAPGKSWGSEKIMQDWIRGQEINR